MEYLIGSLATFIILIGLYLVINKVVNDYTHVKIRHSQSRTHSIIAPFLQNINMPINQRETQSTRHDQKNDIKVVLIDGSAYWIKDNNFYTAYIDMHGTIDTDTTRLVDIMSLSSVELDKMLFIMDKLREGLTDDSGSAGQ